ncbi:unnamed protein product [Closterium sp. NIES-54]
MCNTVVTDHDASCMHVCLGLSFPALFSPLPSGPYLFASSSRRHCISPLKPIITVCLLAPIPLSPPFPQGLISLLAAADAIASLLRKPSTPDLPKQLVFLALNGERWGYLGSRRLLFELEKWSKGEEGVGREVLQGLSLDEFAEAQMLEVGSVGMAGAGGNGTQENVTLFMHHEKPMPTGAAAMAEAVRAAAASIKRNSHEEGEGETASAAEEEVQASVGVRVEEASEETPGLPPSSLLAMSAEQPLQVLMRLTLHTPNSHVHTLPSIFPCFPFHFTLPHLFFSLPQHPGLSDLHLSDFNKQVSHPYLNSHLHTLPSIHPTLLSIVCSSPIPPHPSPLSHFVPSIPQHPGLSALHLSDFNQQVSNPYLNSHLDTLPSVHLPSLTLSATLLARSLLLLSGAPPSLALQASVSTSLISNLVLCLLSPSPGLLCPLASSLLTPRDSAPSHYAGVFLGVPRSSSPASSPPSSSAASSPPLYTLADTPRFVWNFLAKTTAAKPRGGEEGGEEVEGREGREGREMREGSVAEGGKGAKGKECVENGECISLLSPLACSSTAHIGASPLPGRAAMGIWWILCELSFCQHLKLRSYLVYPLGTLYSATRSPFFTHSFCCLTLGALYPSACSLPFPQSPLCLLTPLRYIPALSPRLVFNSTHWSIAPPRPGSHGDLVDPVWTESFWQHLKLRSYLVDDPIWDASILLGGVVWVVVLCVLVTWADKAITQKLKRV